MLFSKKCEYAIRALNHLFRAHHVCKASEISRDQQVPYPYMAKVLQDLKRSGFVNSTRGEAEVMRSLNRPTRFG